MGAMEFLWNEEFWSHPDGVLLSNHLWAVGNNCRDFVHQAGVNDEKILYTAELVGKTHDFGKYTPFFQRYVRGLNINSRLREHSPISALFSAWLVWRELKDEFLTLASFICTLRHHGNLAEDFYDLENRLEDRFGGKNRLEFDPGRYAKQIGSIRANLDRISIEMEGIGIHGVGEFIDELPETYNRLLELLYSMGETKIENAWKKYFILLLIFSALIDADRRDAGQLEKMYERKELDPNMVDAFREKKFKTQSSPLDPLRNEVYKNTMEFLNKNYLPGRIPQKATIVAPTGIGKTLLGFSIALKLREQIYKRTGHMPRIIYVLPYINIIEQTYDVLSKVLDGLAVSPYMLLKHHHQYFLEGDREDMPLDEALLLHDAWDSEVIVTTFAQFLHTLIGGQKNFLRRLHNMFNSIVILDEVQTIQMEYWELMKRCVEEFARNSNSLVIAMTATRPIIFGDWAELVPNYQEVFKKLDRVHYHYHRDEMKVGEMVSWFWSEIWSKKPSSVLMVLNTISSSIAAYKMVKKRFSEDEVVGLGEAGERDKVKDAKRTVLAYLSTNIVPAERRRRIERIKDLLNGGRKVIVVSTQVIEAGVDLSFDVAIRDIGPIDSIIQVAGRCNRSWERRGDVHIVRIVENGEELAPKVYGPLLIHVAKQILEGHCEFQEKDILKIIDEYFNEGYRRKSHEKSKEILEAIERLDFSKISKFELIEDEPKEAVFIELDGEARRALEEFKEAMKKFQEVKGSKDLRKILECRARLRKARVELENWLVAVWDRQAGRLPPTTISGTENTPIYYVSWSSSNRTNAALKYKDKLDKYYDRETGYLIGLA
jgi:CRISPR-associated endonuclease/helicase Cas3